MLTERYDSMAVCGIAVWMYGCMAPGPAEGSPISGTRPRHEITITGVCIHVVPWRYTTLWFFLFSCLLVVFFVYLFVCLFCGFQGVTPVSLCLSNGCVAQ